jgi:hypothetical protein
VFCKFYRLLKTVKRNTVIRENEQRGEGIFEDSVDGGWSVSVGGGRGSGGVAGFSELVVRLVRDSFNVLGGVGGGAGGRKSWDDGLGIDQIIKLCGLLGRKLSREEFFYFVKRCKCVENGVELESGDNSALDVDENSRIVEGGDLRASFYRVMSALEEFNEEVWWTTEEVANFVLTRTLRSSNPISIHEIEIFVSNFRVLDLGEVKILLDEIKYLQSINSNITTDELSLLVRDYTHHYPK